MPANSLSDNPQSAIRNPQSPELRLIGVPGMPEVEAGNPLPSLIVECVRAAGIQVVEGDVFVVAQKVVSKAEGRTVQLAGVEHRELARDWAARYDKDPRMVEVVLQEARRIVRMERGILIAETHHGFVCANAGVDASNVPSGCVTILPRAPDQSAARLRDELGARFDVEIGVIISDTFGRPWREGIVNVAIGIRGVAILLTIAIFALLARRIPGAALIAALREANYPVFLAWMIPNTIFYFCWDTFVLQIVVGWFHGDVPYRDLLPARAASYVVALFNTNVGRGVMVAYLSRKLRAPFLELGSTVIFLVLT